jgi:NTP pyrophosphatase (non-canonical NTP hydrolase)
MKNDLKTSVDSLRQKVTNFRDKRDWEQFHDLKNLAICISIEAAELLEIFRFKTKEEVTDMLKDGKKKSQVTEELVQVIWQCLNFSDVAKIDVTSGLEKALKEAAKKYPVSKFKGKAGKYNEL